MSNANVTAKKTVDRSRLKAQLFALGMLPVLILLAIGFQMITGKFITSNNLSIIMQQASINIVLAAGMTFVILTGGIDLSVGSILAAAAMGGVIVSTWPMGGVLGVVVALLIGLGFGLANGALVAWVGLPPFIVTLGSLTAVRGVARLMGNDTTVFNPDLPFDVIGNGAFLGVPWLAIIAVAVYWPRGSSCAAPSSAPGSMPWAATSRRRALPGSRSGSCCSLSTASLGCAPASGARCRPPGFMLPTVCNSVRPMNSTRSPR